MSRVSTLVALLLSVSGLLSAQPAGICFSELMVAPPETGPYAGVRYIELHNPTAETLSVDSLFLAYRKSLIPLPPISLPPKGYLTFIADSDYPVATLPSAQPLLSFPALSGNFSLYLVVGRGGRGVVVDELYVSSALYGAGYDVGGASVERLNFDQRPPQWRRSAHPDKGTPSQPTTMQPAQRVHGGAVVINEILLSPPTTGEKYFEVYNRSPFPIDLQHLYLSYTNKPNGDHTAWLLSPESRLISPQGYAVVSPYPDALRLHYPHTCDPSTLIERIIFPSVSTTYSEIELRAQADGALVDRVIYRRQWLGNTSGERSGYSLERLAASLPGTERSSWRRALDTSNGGTPGTRNSVDGLEPLSDAEEGYWPEDPKLSFAQMEHWVRELPHRCSLRLYSLGGHLLLSSQGPSAAALIRRLMGRTPPPLQGPGVYVVHVSIEGSEEHPTLHYYDKWLLGL